MPGTPGLMIVGRVNLALKRRDTDGGHAHTKSGAEEGTQLSVLRGRELPLKDWAEVNGRLKQALDSFQFVK